MTEPYPSDSIDKLAQALAAAQAEFPAIPKSREVTVRSDKGAYKFKYAELSTVIECVRPALARHGLAFTQLLVPDGETLVVRTVLLHTSGQFIDSRYPVRLDRQPHQAVGAAITYGKRYSLSGLLGIASEDDTDGDGADAKPETARGRNKRFTAIRDELAASADPGATWHKHIDAINEFLDADRQFYDDLVGVGKRRRDELARSEEHSDQRLDEQDAARAGFGSGFMDTNTKERA